MTQVQALIVCGRHNRPIEEETEIPLLTNELRNANCSLIAAPWSGTCAVDHTATRVCCHVPNQRQSCPISVPFKVSLSTGDNVPASRWLDLFPRIRCLVIWNNLVTMGLPLGAAQAVARYFGREWLTARATKFGCSRAGAVSAELCPLASDLRVQRASISRSVHTYNKMCDARIRVPVHRPSKFADFFFFLVELIRILIKEGISKCCSVSLWAGQGPNTSLLLRKSRSVT